MKAIFGVDRQGIGAWFEQLLVMAGRASATADVCIDDRHNCKVLNSHIEKKARIIPTRVGLFLLIKDYALSKNCGRQECLLCYATHAINLRVTFDNVHKNTILTKGLDLKLYTDCLLYTSPSPRDRQKSRMPSSA